MSVRRIRAIQLAPVLALIALLAWAFASPVGASPDDDFHLASIWCANAANTSACKTTSDSRERIVPAGVHYASCYAHHPLESAACQTKYLDQGSRPTVKTDRGNFENSYPPVYYATMSVFVGPDITVSVLVMRLVNILVFIAFATALFLLLPRPRRPTLLWAWMISVVPLGMFLLASNNPSSWAITGIGSAWIALLGYFETTGRRRIALGAIFALAAFIAAGSRGDAALYVGVSVALVICLTFVPTRRYLLMAILPIAMAIVGVLFFLSSRQSAVVESGLASVGGVTPPNANLFNLAFNDLLNIPSLWSGVFGTWNLGWLDTVMPAIVPFGAIVAFVSVFFVGLRNSTRRKTIALTLVVAALLLIPAYVLVKGLNVVGENVQPRYLLPLIVLTAGLGLLTVSGRPMLLNRIQLVVVVGGLAIADSVALYFNMRRYIDGSVGHGWNLGAGMEWWWNMPISPMVIWALGSVAFAALLIVLVKEINRVHAIK